MDADFECRRIVTHALRSTALWRCLTGPLGWNIWSLLVGEGVWVMAFVIFVCRDRCHGLHDRCHYLDQESCVVMFPQQPGYLGLFKLSKIFRENKTPFYL